MVTVRRSACSAALLSLFFLSRAHAQPATAISSDAGAPQAAPGQATGTGTAGRIAKWTSPSNLGDSVMTESAGKIGISAGAPLSKLDVNGGSSTTVNLFNVYGAGAASVFGRISNSNAAGRTRFALAQTPADTATPFYIQRYNSGHATLPNVAEIVNASNAALIFKTSASERLRITGGGNVGIGVAAPASRLSVAGVIQSTSGGFRFPDGTVQTTAGGGGLSSVAHNATLAGNGTSGSPLRVAVPLNLSGTSGAILQVINSAALNTGIFSQSSGGVAVQGRALGAGTAVYGSSDSGRGVEGISLGNAYGVYGSSASSIGVLGESGDDYAVYGVGYAGGVFGRAPGGFGVYGLSEAPNGQGVVGEVFSPGAYGVWGRNSTGYAGFFSGSVHVTGTLSKAGGSFKIDHPLDPANRYLSHSFVESPDMMNIYNGNVVTDGDGRAVMRLPAWFQALNRDFRYQLTVIGQFAQAIVAEKITGNRFVIRTDKPNVEVSWQVTGIRQDAWANKHRVVVEEEKPETERGSYLHPEAFDEPEERGLEWALHPEHLRRMREERLAGPRPGRQQ